MNDINPETFGAYGRRCGFIFAAVACATLLMVGASYAPLHNRNITIALVLAVACFNAFMVAGYLMHLVTERKMIFAVLVFTAFFAVMLVTLTTWAAHDLPGASKY